MWKWVLIGALVLFFVPGFVLLAVPGDFYSSLSFELIAPKEPTALGKRYVEEIRHKDFVPVEKALNRKYATPRLPSVLAELSAQFPVGEPRAVRLVGFNWLELAKGQKIYTLFYEYYYPNDHVVAKVLLSEGDGLTVVEGLHISRVDEQTLQAREFGFRGKTPGHFLYLATLLAVYVFTLVSVFYCMKTPIPHFKWAWVIFVMLGFVTFRFNWATGNLTIQPFSFLLCSVGFIKVPLGPLILQAAIPVGAIVFWLRRSLWLEAGGPDIRSEASAQ